MSLACCRLGCQIAILGLIATIRFAVVGSEGNDLRVSFDRDEAGKLGIRALIERTVVKSAA